jgi:hypothetical protein
VALWREQDVPSVALPLEGPDITSNPRMHLPGRWKIWRADWELVKVLGHGVKELRLVVTSHGICRTPFSSLYKVSSRRDCRDLMIHILGRAVLYLIPGTRFFKFKTSRRIQLIA